MKVLLRFAALFFLLFVPSLSALAQTAQIHGSIIDPSGAAVIGARITISAHGETHTATSDASGSYRFNALNSGTYTLTVESPGFSRYENTSIHLSNASDHDWPISLALQSASQTIVVQGDAEALDLTPSVGKTGTVLQEIPQSINIISHQLSETQGDLSLHDTIRNSSGVIQGGTDGFGFADRFQIRGMEARIFNDGFSDGDERNGIPHSLNGVERVEILEGPGSALFGSGPPGGTINLVHYTPSPRLAAGAQFQTGSFGLYSGSAYFTNAMPFSGLNYRFDGLFQHTDGFRSLHASDYELRPVLGITKGRNVLLLAGDARYLQATPDPAGLIYLNGKPITVVPRTTNYSTPFGFGNQSIARFTGSDIWQATPFVTFNTRGSYLFRNLSILRNGDGGSVSGTQLIGRSLRNQHDVVNDVDLESEPVFNFLTGKIRHTLLTGIEYQHQTIGANRSTATLQSIPNIFAPVIPETSRASLNFLRDATHSGFIDHLSANYGSIYATDQIDLTSRLKLRIGGREDIWNTNLTPLIFVAGRSLGNGVLIEPPRTFSRTDTPFSWNTGLLYRALPGVSLFFGAARSNLANFNSEATQNGVEAPESGIQYEAGVKVAEFNDRIQITASAFHVKRDNVFSLLMDVPVFNDQLTQGGEGNIELAITSRWHLNANATGMHASLTNNPSAPAGVGQRPQGVPNRIVNLWTSYDVLHNAQTTVSLAGGFNNRSSMFANIPNTLSIPAYTVADVVANVTSRNFTGSFGVRNLTNTRYFTAANGVGGFVGDARTFFGKLQYQFGSHR